MSSRDIILEKIRIANQNKPAAPKPDLSEIDAIRYADVEKKFSEVLMSVGGKVAFLEEGGSLEDTVKKLYPDAVRIASNMPEVSSATINPDEVDDPALLDGTDLAVVRGRFGVAENGAVWIEQDVRQRAVYFISEALVIVLPKGALVNNMLEAYRRIGEDADYEFGGFISGPSKTADIEQALVFGAHGARDVTVLFV